jgi:hypothetical protein
MGRAQAPGIVALGLAATLWCAAAGDAHAVVGGVPSDEAAVVRVEVAGEGCSGTVIAPRVVLTAAHCLVGADAASVLVQIGQAAPWEAELAVDRIWRSRSFMAVGEGGGVDVALLHLAEDAPVPSLVLASVRPTAGALVRAVGFGRSAPDAVASAGQRREVELAVLERLGDHVRIGDGARTTCRGDSGGPLLARGTIVGVVSAGAPGCDGVALAARLDRVAPQLAEVIAAWDGVCAADDVCTDGCVPIADADCDACGYQGVCEGGCAAVDLDCPLGGALGDDCVVAWSCEERRCAPAPDAPSVAFCSRACIDDTDCVAPLARCADGACAFVGDTPGAPGAACVDDAECRQGPCDRGPGVCTAPCGDGESCPAGLVCAPVGDGRACTAPATGCGGCGGADGGGPAAAAMLAWLGLGASRRRRPTARPLTRWRS